MPLVSVFYLFMSERSSAKFASGQLSVGAPDAALLLLVAACARSRLHVLICSNTRFTTEGANPLCAQIEMAPNMETNIEK